MERLELISEPDVRQNLPPDLLLPTADEPTEKFRRENFKPRTLANYVEYGTFMVALMVWEAETTGTDRVSFMPTSRDFEDLYEAGYGVSCPPPNELDEVLIMMGFYPPGYRPEEKKLQRDMQGLAQHSLRPHEDFDPAATNIKQLLPWFWARDLLPSKRILYSVLKRRDVAETFAVERYRPLEQYTFAYLYRFGAKVLRENHGKPPTRDQLNEMYADEFIGEPSSTIRAFFGSYRAFWLEFELVVDAKGMTDQEAVNLGIRHAIATGEPRISNRRARELSKNNKLPILRLQKIGFITYQRMIDAGYDAYLRLRDRFIEQGVSSDVVKAACQKFEHSLEFETWLEQHISALQILSNGSVEADRLLERIQNGLDLENDAQYNWELATIHEDMDDLGLTNWQRRFVLDLIPRLDTREALASKPTAAKTVTEVTPAVEKGVRFDLTDWGEHSVQIVIREGQRVVKVRRRAVFDAAPWATDVIEWVFDKGGCLSDELLEVAQQKEPGLKKGDLYKMLDAFRKFLHQYAPASLTNWQDRMVRTQSGSRKLVQARRTGVGKFTEPEEPYWG